MEQRDYSKDIPLEPPEDMILWLRRKGYFKKHILLYKAAWEADPLSGERERVVELKCSACGKRMYAGRVETGGCHNGRAAAPFGYWDPVEQEAHISGDGTKCPMCGAEVRARHTADFRNGITVEEVWPLQITRVEDKLVIIGWYGWKYITHECEERVGMRHYEAYVVEQKKVVRLMGYQRCLSSVSFFPGWEQRKTCLDNWGAAPLVYPWKASLLEGTTAENSKLDLYMRSAPRAYPVTYLRLWQRHSNIENLVVQGCGRLVSEMIDKESMRFGYQRAKGVPKLPDVFWKERRPSKMLGLTGEELQYCRKMMWDLEALRFYRNCKGDGVKLKLPEDMAACINTKRLYWCDKVRNEKQVPMMRAVRYLNRQIQMDKRVDAGILSDYWRIAEGEGYNLTDDHVRFPKDLMREHDRVMKERDARMEAERKKTLAAKYEGWKVAFDKQLERLQAYAWSKDGILIRPAAAPEELDAEGKTLSHCVAGYKDTHAKGERVIFFIRREEKPDEPWYTLELNTKSMTVCQNRGKANCARTPAVEAFEAAWLEHIKTLKKRGKAA